MQFNTDDEWFANLGGQSQHRMVKGAGYGGCKYLTHVSGYVRQLNEARRIQSTPGVEAVLNADTLRRCLQRHARQQTSRHG
jgi:hypothetical protein